MMQVTEVKLLPRPPASHRTLYHVTGVPPKPVLHEKTHHQHAWSRQHRINTGVVPRKPQKRFHPALNMQCIGCLRLSPFQMAWHGFLGPADHMRALCTWRVGRLGKIETHREGEERQREGEEWKRESEKRQREGLRKVHTHIQRSRQAKTCGDSKEGGWVPECTPTKTLTNQTADD